MSFDKDAEDIDAIAWCHTHEQDLWIYDKLIVARRMGYYCGPAGKNVDKAGNYIVRPCVNIPGMGKGAEFVHLTKTTDHLPLGHFWCEIFRGRHLSVDYQNRQQFLTVEGFRDENSPIWKFHHWKKVDDILPIPSIVDNLVGDYPTINIEYIGGKVIEIHFRRNPNFDYNNNVAYPVWDDEDYSHLGLRYIQDPSFLRKGFWVD